MFRVIAGSVRDSGRWLATALCLLGSALAAPSPGVTLHISGPAVPYAHVEYTLEAREDGVVVSVTKTHAAKFGYDSTVGLLPQDALRPLLAKLAQGSAQLGAPRAAGARANYRITWHDGAREGRVEFSDPERLPTPAQAALVREIRALVEQATEPLEFKDALLLPEEYGRLRIASRPPGTVRIDGVAIPGQTPLRRLRLEAGPHRVSITPLGGGPAFHYDVKVRVGRTTSLAVELK